MATPYPSPSWRRYLRFWRENVPADVDDEIAFHIDARTRELVSAGSSPDDARRTALREFGDVERARAMLRSLDEAHAERARRGAFLDQLRTDLRFALRTLARNRGFTAVAVLTLALGIGANSAIFSVVNAVILKPLPFPRPNELLFVRQLNTGIKTGGGTAPASVTDLEDWRRMRKSLADLGGYFYGEGSSGIDLTGQGEPQRLSATFVTPGFWGTLGVAPEAGRLPRDDEIVRGADDKVVVLSHVFWLRQFGGSPAAIGKRITLSGTSYHVVGAMPAAFRFPAPDVDVYLAYSSITDDMIPHIRAVRSLDVVARMRPGTTIATARAELDAIARRLAEIYPEDGTWGAVAATPLSDRLVGPVRRALFVLLGAVTFVLLITAVNLASLMLARGVARQRELAVRAALGAPRGRIVRQLLTESLVVATLGGASGLLVAVVGVRAFLALASGQLPRAQEVTVDPAVLAFTAGVALVTGVAFGLVPALRVSSPAPQAGLREGARGSTSAGGRLRNVLVVAEVALAVVLVVGAGLMGKSFVKLLGVDLGFTPDHRVAIDFSISDVRHSGDNRLVAYYRAVLDEVRSVPGVTAASGIRDLPFHGNGERVGFLRMGEGSGPNGELPSAVLMFAADGFFQTMGIPLLSGRDLSAGDRANAPTAVVVNAAFARKYLGGASASAVGQRIRLGGDTVAIVGLVGDARQLAVDEPAQPMMYASVFQIARSRVNLVVRTRDDPALMIKRLEEAIRTVDPEQTFTAAYTLDDAVGEAMARPRLVTVLLGLFAGMGMIVGALGIYGVLAYLVTRRTREIGVRLALGASRASVQGMVVGRGLALGGFGVALGLVVAAALTRFMSGVLYGVGATDPITFGGVAVALLAVAALASWLPARRASRVDPVVALRSE